MHAATPNVACKYQQEQLWRAPGLLSEQTDRGFRLSGVGPSAQQRADTGCPRLQTRSGPGLTCFGGFRVEKNKVMVGDFPVYFLYDERAQLRPNDEVSQRKENRTHGESPACQRTFGQTNNDPVDCRHADGQSNRPKTEGQGGDTTYCSGSCSWSGKNEGGGGTQYEVH